MSDGIDVNAILKKMMDQNDSTLNTKDLEFNERQYAVLRDEYAFLGSRGAVDWNTILLLKRQCSNTQFGVLPDMDLLFEAMAALKRTEKACAKVAEPKIRADLKLNMLQLILEVMVIAKNAPDDTAEKAQYRRIFHERINALPEADIFREAVRMTANEDARGVMEMINRLCTESQQALDKVKKPWEALLIKIFQAEPNAESWFQEDLPMDRIDEFIQAINASHEILQGKEATQEEKATLVWGFIQKIEAIEKSKDASVSNEIFRRRGEMIRASLLRNYFVASYLQEKVHYVYGETTVTVGSNFYYEELKAVFHAKYGEEDLLGFRISEEKKKYTEMLSSRVQVFLKRQQDQAEEMMRLGGLVFRKVRKFKEEGKTDAEIAALITDEEKQRMEIINRVFDERALCLKTRNAHI